MLQAPPPPDDALKLPAESGTVTEPGFSKWLFVVGLSLLVVPALCIHEIAEKIPALLSDEGRSLALEHPGFDQLIYFEICMNVVLVVAALVLNFFFYARSRYFPKAMVGFVALNFAYRLAIAGATHALFPNEVMTQSAYALAKYLAWGATMAGFLLLNSSVNARFQN